MKNENFTTHSEFQDGYILLNEMIFLKLKYLYLEYCMAFFSFALNQDLRKLRKVLYIIFILSY